jgi:hypothetical protein
MNIDFHLLRRNAETGEDASHKVVMGRQCLSDGGLSVIAGDNDVGEGATDVDTDTDGGGVRHGSAP